MKKQVIEFEVDGSDNISLPKHSFDSNCNCDHCAKTCDHFTKSCDDCNNDCDQCTKLREGYIKECNISLRGCDDDFNQKSMYDSVSLIETGPKVTGKPQKNYVFLANIHYWLLHLNCILYCFGQSVVFTHIMAYGESESLSANQGAALISAIGFANIAGRIILGAICSLPHVNLVLLLSLCYCSAGLAILLCTMSSDFVYLMSLMLLFGFASGAFGPVVCEVCCRIVRVEYFASAYGIILISMGTGTLIGAPIAGKCSLMFTSLNYS